MSEGTAIALAPRKQSLVEVFSARMGIDPEKMLPTLKATAFRTDKPITNEQMAALLIVAEQYHLNPFTRELFAFPDKSGGVVPYISVDGWSRIVNEHPQFNGWTFKWDAQEQAITCTIHRKDRDVPCEITEYMSECKRNTDPWNKAPRRMLRHKALMQCGRLAFGFAGLYDEEEAQFISSGTVERVEAPSASAQAVRNVLRTTSKHLDVSDAQEVAPPAPQPDEGPDAKTLAEYMRELRGIADQEIASLLLDEARGFLSEAEAAQLIAAYQELFTPTTTTKD